MPLFTDFDPEEGLISPGFEKLGLAPSRIRRHGISF